MTADATQLYGLGAGTITLVVTFQWAPPSLALDLRQGAAPAHRVPWA